MPLPAPQPASLKPARPAAGITYEPGVAGLVMFRCEPLRATMTVKGCGTRWAAAQGKARTGRRARHAQHESRDTNDRLIMCRGCPIGAAHAGHDHVVYSRLYGSAICPACRRGATRMIHNRICVSCYNRRRELKAGKNARGNVPAELLQRPLHHVEFKLAVNGQARRVRSAPAADLLEPVIQALRTTKGAAAFGFQGPVGVLRQGRLF